MPLYAAEHCCVQGLYPYRTRLRSRSASLQNTVVVEVCIPVEHCCGQGLYCYSQAIIDNMELLYLTI